MESEIEEKLGLGMETERIDPDTLKDSALLDGYTLVS